MWTVEDIDPAAAAALTAQHGQHVERRTLARGGVAKKRSKPNSSVSIELAEEPQKQPKKASKKGKKRSHSDMDDEGDNEDGGHGGVRGGLFFFRTSQRKRLNFLTLNVN